MDNSVPDSLQNKGSGTYLPNPGSRFQNFPQLPDEGSSACCGRQAMKDACDFGHFGLGPIWNAGVFVGDDVILRDVPKNHADTLQKFCLCLALT